MWKLACQDSIVTPAAHGPAAVPGTCSVSEGDAIGWWQSGTGIIPANTYQSADCTASNPKCVFWKYPTPAAKAGATLTFVPTGQMRVYSIGVTVCSAWGASFLIAVLVCAALYVGSGIAFSHHTLGKRFVPDGARNEPFPKLSMPLFCSRF